MKKVFGFVIFVTLQSGNSYACTDNSVLQVGYSGAPKVLWAKDQNYCEGTPVIDLKYKDIFAGENLATVNVSIERKGEIIFDVNVASLSDENGSYFCLNSDYLKDVRVVVDYGYDNCLGYVYRFGIDDLSTLKSDGSISLKMLSRKK